MMKISSLFNQYDKKENGSTIVISALAMVALIGISAFVLDLGIVYHESSKLQNGLDSATLAAVQELPADSQSSIKWINAKNEACSFARLNHIDLMDEDIQPVYEDDGINDKIIGIKVNKTMQVNYSFAKVFGLDSGTIERTATAEISPAGGIKGAIPLSISASSLNEAIAAGAISELTIKCCSNADDIGIDSTGVSGWFGALRFENSGASIYSNLLAYGYSGVLRVGQILEMENGNMSGPTLDGFTTRYNQCTSGCTADSFEPDCPKLVYIPVIEVLSSSKVKVVAFAAFFLLECGGNGNNSYIKAAYTKNTVLPDAASGTEGEDFGLYVSKLSE